MTAVIFAGGKSSRMGRDKALLPFGGFSTLSQFQQHKLSQLFSDVYLSSKEDKFDFDAQVIKDHYKESSPLVGIISIFESLDVEEVFVLSVDAPLVDEAVIARVCSQSKEDFDVNTDAIIAQSPDGLQPLCGIYRRSILTLAKRHLAQNNHRLTTLLKASSMKVVKFDSNTPFTNLNTQEEYQKLYP
jgi:molybdopterin-guanine dinucleotide biosynthesis protein A